MALVQLLLGKGADTKAVDGKQWTVLYGAARLCGVESTKLRLGRGPDVNAGTPAGERVLHEALGGLIVCSSIMATLFRPLSTTD